MDGINYNMADVFGGAFGKQNIPLVYDLKNEVVQNPSFNYDGLGRIGAEEITDGTSWLGTPINFKFGIKSGNYNYLQGGRIEQRRVSDFQFPLTTMVSISRAKRDRITPTAGGKGTVKELYAFDDWQIRIQGVCQYDPGHPQAVQPQAQRLLIAQLEDAADSFELQEAPGVFTDLSIYKLYIRSVRFGQFKGKPNQIPFELTCLSDEPLELLQ